MKCWFGVAKLWKKVFSGFYNFLIYKQSYLRSKLCINICDKIDSII